MQKQPFDRSKHVYKNDAFNELVKDAIRFFHGTPVHTMPPPEKFLGQGVYALYYTGQHEIYKRYSELNRLAYDAPIYVGKAVPSGWRQARNIAITSNIPTLYNRIKEHARNLKTVGLDTSNFYCRFVIFENEGAKMISTIESELISLKRPLWNTIVDGFGNHTPGAGRFNQSVSAWDVIHPGRDWAKKCLGAPPVAADILRKIEQHLSGLK